MAIQHIVIFKFKALVPAEEVKTARNRMLALKTECLHPTTKQEYVKTSIGGTNTSPEGHDKGFTHVFVSEFENEDDRKYYLQEDPAHVSFVKYVGPLLEDIMVVDFTPGEF